MFSQDNGEPSSLSGLQKGREFKKNVLCLKIQRSSNLAHSMGNSGELGSPGRMLGVMGTEFIPLVSFQQWPGQACSWGNQDLLLGDPLLVVVAVVGK